MASRTAASSRPLRVGLIGLGGINRVHIEGYRLALDGAEVVAVCDNVERTVNERAAELGAAPYLDHQGLLADADVDMVDVTLPHSLHYPVARDALLAGKHVLVEKPLAVRSTQCRELIDLALEGGLTLTVAENTRFVAAYEATRRLLGSGVLGRVRTVRTLIYGSEVRRLRQAGWVGSRDDAGGGVILDSGVHSYYLVEWLFGQVRQVRATMGTLIPESEVEDHAVVTGTLEGDVVFTCELTCTAELPWGERLEVCAEHGAVIVDQLSNPVALHYRGEDDFEPVALADVPFDPRGWKKTSIAAGVCDFVQSVREDRRPTVDVEDGFRAVLIAEKAYESVGAGGTEVVL